jgi:hypothetical protein
LAEIAARNEYPMPNPTTNTAAKMSKEVSNSMAVHRGDQMNSKVTEARRYSQATVAKPVAKVIGNHPVAAHGTT